MRFHKRYFLYTILLLLIEIFIALYVRDTIIRPYGGDFLVVILIYYFVRTFWDGAAWQVAIGTLLFSYLVDFLQYFKIVEVLGLQGNRFWEIVIGTGFSWWDMLAYTLGVLVVYWVDKITS